MSLFKSKCSKSKLPNTKKIAEHSKVFCFKFTDICRQDRHAVTVSSNKNQMLDPKVHFGSTKDFRSKEILGPKNFGSKKIFLYPK